MEELVFNYNGNNISFAKGDNVLVNATQMAKPFGSEKRPQFWLGNQSTKDFLAELSKARNLTLTDLVEVTKGGTNPGTWMHEDVILEYARWLSPKLSIWCNDRIKELLRNGTTSISKPLSTLDMLELSIKQLREQSERVSAIEDKVNKIEANTHNRPEYMSVVGFASLNNINIGLKLAASIGRKASKICKENDYTIETIPDPRFGRVNIYPQSVLEQVFNQPIN